MEPTADPLAPSTPRWSDRGHWLALAPGMHIDDADFFGAARCVVVPEETAAAIREDLRVEGYFKLEPLGSYVDVARAAGAVAAVAHAGWAAPFAFVYDEIWLLFMQLNQLLSGLLGPGFLRLPDFWAWHVDPRNRESGWRPHRDKGRRALLPSGMPQTVTIWLPLTDATPLNGCIYLVPANLDPTYGTPQEDTLSFPLQAIRAVPAAAGSVLGWNAAIAHWGSSSAGRASVPRISLALEFQRGDVPPFNLPVMAPDAVPAFEGRLILIAQQLLQYRHMYELAPASEELARSILASAR